MHTVSPYPIEPNQFPAPRYSTIYLGGRANKIIEWCVSKLRAPAKFPKFPAFQARYTVTSSYPEAGQRFFDECNAHYFSNTEYDTLRAAGDLFVLYEVKAGFNPRTNPK